MASQNREWLFKARPGPAGFSATECFELRDCAAAPPLEPGQLLISPHLFSVDPTLRNALAGPDAYEAGPGSAYWSFMNWEPGTVPSWFMTAQVRESTADGFAKGQLVYGMAPWRELSAVAASGWELIADGTNPEDAMSTLGMTGATGYLGAKHIALPKDGNVAYVSGAAGATGLVAAQTFKNLGCKVVGSAGSDEKVALLESLGISSFNYKKESVLAGLQRLCPGGIDVSFDNVGGETLEAIIEMTNDTGRIAVCGAISQYDTRPSERYGVKNTFQLVAKRIKMEGFLVFQFSEEQQAECKATLRSWLAEGKIKSEATLVDGFENLIKDGLGGLFSGSNTGKLLIRMPLTI